MDLEGQQSTRMVLHNLELLERILQYHSECKKTLFSASLAAKAFSEPAFNVLWYEMKSIWPLFRILPTFKRGPNGNYLFTGAIRTEHLQRVLYYAKRIRVFDYMNVEDGPYSRVPRDLIISTFMRMDKLGAFVPLRKIYFNGSFLHTMLFPLTSPYLESIEIRTGQTPNGSTEIGIASSLQSVAPSPLLKSLVIEGPFTNITLQVLPDFINLQTLSIYLHNPDIPAQLLKLFASSMPSLRQLDVSIYDPNFTPPTDGLPKLGQPLRHSFPSLEIFSATGNSTRLESLFHGLDAPRLKSVMLGLHHVTPGVGAHMDKFVKTNQQLLKGKVHRLIINSTDPSLSFVKAFETLRELIVLAPGAIPMTVIADTFRGQSWSRLLTHLTLTQPRPTEAPNCMTTTALYFIADACPNLKFLKISIHQGKPKQFERKCKPHSLTTLIFRNLPGYWDDTMPLAIELVSLLDQIFTSMAVPSYVGAEEDKPGALAARKAWWKGVEDMWKMCQTMKDRKK